MDIDGKEQFSFAFFDSLQQPMGFQFACGQALAMFRKDGDKKTGPQCGDREDRKSETTIGTGHPWKFVRASISQNAGGQYFR